jgi:hypothetical protein
MEICPSHSLRIKGILDKWSRKVEAEMNLPHFSLRIQLKG